MSIRTLIGKHARGMFGVCTGYVYSFDAVRICSFNAAERGPEPLGAHYGRLPFHYAKPFTTQTGVEQQHFATGRGDPDFLKCPWVVVAWQRQSTWVGR